MEDIKKAFHDLFYNIVKSRSDLKFINELENFCRNYVDDKDFKKYRIKVRSAMSMIYDYNQVFNESFVLDMELLNENQFEEQEYIAIITRAAKVSSILMRTNEVKVYAEKFILNENQKHFFSKLSLLDWYVSNYPNEVDGNKFFFEAFLKVAQALGSPYFDEYPLAERINLVSTLNKDASKLTHQFQMNYREASRDVRPDILKNFLNATPLKYYQDIMIQSSHDN